jgi:anaerobic ribonucleoside-triphosphate reductase activating protein
MNIQVAAIKTSFTDGTGHRVSLYVQGCLLHCAGCQSPHLWSLNGGKTMDTTQVANVLNSFDLPVTIIGGEPVQQAEAVAEIVKRLKSYDRHVIVYTGYTYEELVHAKMFNEAIADILMHADILVDGRYDQTQDDSFLQYRGSRNQRPIDLVQTRQTGRLTILIDWDESEYLVLENGDILAAEGLLSEGEYALMCGEIM